jgi:hypothetical protein
MLKGWMATQRDLMDPVAMDQVLMPVWVAMKGDSALIRSCSVRAVFAEAGEVRKTHSESRENWVVEANCSVVNLA